MSADGDSGGRWRDCRSGIAFDVSFRGRGRSRGQLGDFRGGRGDFRGGTGDFRGGRGDFRGGRGDFRGERGDLRGGIADFARGRGDLRGGIADFARGRGGYRGGGGAFEEGRGNMRGGRGDSWSRGSNIDVGRGRGRGNLRLGSNEAADISEEGSNALNSSATNEKEGGVGHDEETQRDWQFGYVIALDLKQCIVSIEDNPRATEGVPLQLTVATQLGLLGGDRLRYRIDADGSISAASIATAKGQGSKDKISMQMTSIINKVEQDPKNPKLVTPFIAADGVGLRFHPEKADFGGWKPKVGDEVSFVLQVSEGRRLIFDVRLLNPTARSAEELQQFVPILDKAIQSEKLVSALLSVPCAWRVIGSCSELQVKHLLPTIQFFVKARSKASVHQLAIIGDCVLELMDGKNFKADSGVFHDMFQDFSLLDKREVQQLKEFVQLVADLVKDRCHLMMKVAQPFLEKHFTTQEVIKLTTTICSNYLPRSVSNSSWNELPPLLQKEEIRMSTQSGVNRLAPIRADSPYDSQEQYFDTCLRLLRADCFEKLRVCVQQFVKNQLNNNDMAVYFRVELRGVDMSQRELSLALHVSPFNRTVRNWDRSPLLMFGNLLCLSFDEGFTDFVWLTVSNRNANLLQTEGIILVEVCSDANCVGDAELLRRLSSCDRQLWVAESPTYYQAYRYVLSNLQEMHGQQMPLCKELVQCDFSSIEELGEMQRDLPLFKGEREENDDRMMNLEEWKAMQMCQRNTIVRDRVFTLRELRNPYRNYESFQSSDSAQACSIPRDISSDRDTAVRDEDKDKDEDEDEDEVEDEDDLKMPKTLADLKDDRVQSCDSTPACSISQPKTKAESLKESILEKLDQSQAEAFSNCTKRRFSVVQGPPGCGKTYLGSHLVRYLTATSKGPLLLVTYKNNALDEFIKKIKQQYEQQIDIIRFGGRSSKTDVTDDLNIKHRRERLRYSAEWTELYSRQDETKVDIQRILGRLSNLENLEFNERFLNYFWSEETRRKFVQHMYSDPYLRQLLANLQSFHQQLRFAVQTWRPHIDQAASIINYFKRMHAVATPPNVEQQLRSKDKDEEEVENEEEEMDDEKEQQKLERLAVSGGGKADVELSIRFRGCEERSRPYLLQKSICGFVKEKWKTLRFCSNPWQLSPEDRVLFMQGCLLDFLERNWNQAMPHLEAKLQELGRQRDKFRDLSLKRDVQICASADVIAMTITGASINNELLKQLKPQTVVVEEAGEIMEPMLLGCLGSWTKRLFLIGDHQQLRPNVENYHLVKHCNLDVSLMERLINNNFPYDQLQMQNRMRPDISKYLRDIYPKLQDNMDSVKDNELPCFIPRGVTFWDLSQKTDEKFKENGDRSFINLGEAEIIVQLAMAFLRFGYRPKQITILAAYQGQVSLIRRLLRTELTGKTFPNCDDDDDDDNDHNDDDSSSSSSSSSSRTIIKRVSSKKTKSNKTNDKAAPILIQTCTIDFYQGDENEVVLVSLVRTEQPGFLKSRNRRCVAQSRSRSCLVFVGNAPLLRRTAAWADFIDEIQSNDALHQEMPVQCQWHKTRSSWRSAKQISAKNSCFCFEKCEQEMECQKHHSNLPCHPWHEHRKCKHNVTLKLECDHTLTAPCHLVSSQRMPPCEKRCNRQLKCGHRCKRLCYKTCSELKCKEKVQEQRSCGHVIEKLCNQPDSLCQENATKKLQCGHLITKPCYVMRDKAERLVCTKKCERTLECGHTCGGICGEPCRRYMCKVKATATCVTCGEEFKSVCSDRTSQCQKKRQLSRSCGHQEQVLCSNYKLAAESACKVPCTKKLSCKHTCKSSCHEGQDCPDCREKVTRPKCKHPCECWEQENDCFTQVRVKLECGHREMVECCTSRRLNTTKCSSCWTAARVQLQRRKAALAAAGETAIQRSDVTEDNADTSAEYFKVHDRVMRYMKQEHRLQVKEIHSIERIHNAKQDQQLMEMCDQLHKKHCLPELLIHGTSSAAAESIIKDGFKVGSGGMYGAGIYFATDTTKSVQYCRESGMMSLLLCEVLLGKTKVCTSPQNHLNLEAVDGEGCDSVFAKRNTKGTGGVMNDEYIVYRPEQAAPRYLIKFTASSRNL